MRKVILISTDETVVNLLNSNAGVLEIEPEVTMPSGDLLSEIKEKKPDLLIIDFILNDDNGGGLCHQVKSDSQLHGLPIILLSEYPSLERIATKFGCSTMITKPLNLYKLTEGLQNLGLTQSGQ